MTTKNDKRPDSSRLISSFDEPLSAEGTFGGERTIPGQYSSLSEHTEHGGYSGFADLVDPGLGGPMLDGDFAERTQTDLVLDSATHGHEHHDAQEQMHELLLVCLDAVDDVDKMLAVARADESKGESRDDLVGGLDSLRKRLLDKIGAYGVTPDPALGRAFDPAVHEIVREQTVDDDSDADTVMAVERDGYVRHGHPLRRARVVMGKKR